jgi:hypothetical protein
MDSHDRSTDPVPGGPTAIRSDEPVKSAGRGATDRAPGRAGTLWTAALSAGLLAGVVAWLIGEAAHEYFPPKLVETTIRGRTGRGATPETMNEATVKNAVLVFGVLGAVLGLSLGAGGGLAQRAARAAAVAAAVGLINGAVAGVAAAAAVLPRALRTEEFREDNLVRPFLIYVGLWVPLGVAAGLAFGLGAGRRRGPLLAAAVGGGLGAVLGTGTYELIGGLAFHFARTLHAFSLTWATRLLARLRVTLGSAAGAALGAADRAVPSPSSPPAGGVP